jgi:glycerol-3-phosphate O-acyltransferase / dihydroxyacetone phosphate acyltransferase
MSPVRWYLTNYAENKRRQALKKSTVKIKGNDVVASWKIMIGLFLFPAAINFASFLFFIFRSHVYASTWTGRILVSVLFSFLFTCYLVYCVQLLNGVKTNMRTVVIRFFLVIYRKTIAKLRKTRKDLKRQVKDVMDKYFKLNQHKLIKRKSLSPTSDKFDMDLEEIFGELNDIMVA